jgi:hypothetical protein
MKILLTTLLTVISTLAIGQDAIEYQESLNINATFDQKEVKRIKKTNDFQIEFIGLNKFKIKGSLYDTLGLECELVKSLTQRRRTKTILIIDSKDRTYEEHIAIVGQLHRTLLRVKDNISLMQLGVRYKEVQNQKDLDDIDRIVPSDIIDVN